MQKNIFFIVPSMRGGGSEKVISILANNLNRNKFRITLVLLIKDGVYLNDLKSDIKIIDLNCIKARYSIYKLYKLIKEYQPDIVFSTLGHLNLLLALLKYFIGKEVKFIARESSIVSVNNKYNKFPKIFNFLYRKVYNNLDLIIAQSQYMKNDLINHFDVKEEKILVINNPIEHEKILALSKEDSCLDLSKKNLLNIGSLTRVKNQIALLDVINALDSTYHLTILGEGKLEEELKKEIKKLKLENKVTLKGFDLNPYKYLKDSTYLLISSKYEGFPNVALEAIACSTPVIAFNAIGGLNEIIKDSKNGFIIEFNNVEEMVNKIIFSTFNKEEVYKTSIKYDKSSIIKIYETILESL